MIYANGPKNQERREYYAYVDWCHGKVVRPAERRALILEDKEGRDVRELLQRRYAPENIWAVNRNAALIATMNRELVRRVNPVGVELRDAVRHRFAPQGRSFHVLNLDFCESVSERLLRDIWLASTTLEDGGVVRVAVQRGRESGGWHDYAKARLPFLDAGGDDVELSLHGRELTAWDRVRFRAVLAALTMPTPAYPGRLIARSRVVIYRSAGAKVDMLAVYAQLIYPSAAGVANVPLRRRILAAREAAR